jgi:putative DNA primase/helicase
LRRVVEEVQRFTKAPTSLVASAALAAVSLAAQAQVDVKRAERLDGPISLFLLTIADSGERKSTCDDFFTRAIRKFQAEQAEIAKPILEAYRANLDAWGAKRAAILDGIRGDTRKGKDTRQKERSLYDLEQNKPQTPKVPQLILGDETPENLAWKLAKDWPSAGYSQAKQEDVLQV